MGVEKNMREREPNIIDDTSLAPEEYKEIIRLIRRGAKDLEQKWENAVHLTKKAFEVAGIDIPSIVETGKWEQYVHLISLSVRELAKSRGLVGSNSGWRITPQSDKLEVNRVLPKTDLS